MSKWTRAAPATTPTNSIAVPAAAPKPAEGDPQAKEHDIGIVTIPQVSRAMETLGMSFTAFAEGVKPLLVQLVEAAEGFKPVLVQLVEAVAKTGTMIEGYRVLLEQSVANNTAAIAKLQEKHDHLEMLLLSMGQIDTTIYNAGTALTVGEGVIPLTIDEPVEKKPRKAKKEE